MECASKIVERAVDVVLDLTIRHVGYIFYYKENVNELRSLDEKLSLQRKRLEHAVAETEDNLGITESDVTAWLQKVDKTRTETEEFQNDEGHTKTRFSSGLFHYFRNRHRLGRKAKKMLVDAKLLIDESKFDGVSYQQKPTSMHAASLDAGYVEIGSRRHTIEKIIEELEDSTVRMIGVHGPGGVGKSTLIKEIVKKAQDKKLFNVVVIVEITDNPNLRKIQEEIAYVLGLSLEGEGESVRADRLRRRLKTEKENTLVVMDDLWDRIDLNKIGIPFDDDDIDDDSSNMIIEDMKGPKFTTVKKGKSPGDYKGCKILLTSRDRKVLSDKMDVKSVFCVRELDDKESLMLFKKVAGTLDEISTFKQEIVKKYCAGLPMAIVTVGRALRNKSESVWEATLEKLKKEELSGVQKSMEISVRMSYDHLESEEMRSIFLLCAQMGHQQLIMDLVKYCFGLGILEGVYTLREARDRVYTSIQKLKDSSLMLDGSSNDHFKMHDMVKDAALSIAHKEQNVFALSNSKLDDWPDKDQLERCTAVSIRNCDIIDELPKVMHCPQLKFFQIDSDDPSLQIPENFFEGMEKLRVLILTGFHFSCLPSSIKCLLNLRMLCLERCVLVDNLSIVGELKKLRILSFSGSQIESLPIELERLDKLQLFDMSNCSLMKVAQPNFISRLTCLEELYIRKSLIKMKVDGEPNQSQISFLSQLKHLHQLRVVDLSIPSTTVLPRDLFFDRLTDYKIVIGDFKMLSSGDFRMPNKYEALRSLALQLTDGADIHSHKGIKLLFKRVENLLLGELNGVQNAFYELNLDGFPDLKHLSIINNDGIEYIVNSMELFHPQNVFLNLESLCLYRLKNIKMLCYTPVTDASFAKLKSIKVKMCTQLKFLFSFYMVGFFACLETIDVSECDSLKEIVVKEGQANFNKIQFHKLRSLTLQSLPSFTSFYTGVETPSVEEQTTKGDHIEITVAEDDRSVVDPLCLFGELIEIPNLESLKLSSIKSEKIWRDQPLSNFCFQNLIKLTVKECYNLKYLCSMSVASNFKKLKGLFISDCWMMEKIFIREGDSVDKVCIFPKLEEIHLTKLNKLTDIWQVEVGADSFSSLISVQIEGCKQLNKVFPSHMTGWFGSLDSLKVIDCMSVEVIFEIKDFQPDASMKVTNLQLILVDQLPNLKQVWDRDPEGILCFKNLRVIEATRCNKLSYLLPASVAKDLKRLAGILVNLCDGMEEIVAWHDGPQARLMFPEVTFMKLYGLPNVKRFYKGGHIECPKLKQLAVDFCEKLDVFTTETTNEERQAVFLAEKVISNLEFMETGLKESLWLKSNNWKYRMDSIKELSLRSLRSIELLYWFLDRMPNLERFNLLFSHYKLEGLVPSGNIVSQERLGTVLQLKTLTLWSSEIKDLGLDRDPLLQRLEHLLLGACDSLVNIAPSSLSLSHLTYLEVNSCTGLMNLMAVSTAKSMVQLATMKVIHCKVKEIVTNEGNEEDRVIEVVFKKLVYLELVRLKDLTSFCRYKNCEFKFPSLERLIVRECPKMQTFTEGQTTAAKLQNILAIEGEEEEKRYWEGDLNITIQKIFKDKISFEYAEKMDLIDYPELLEQVWHCSDLVQDYMFRNLTSLVVSQCNNLVHVIPSHLLPCFENLEELKVWDCSAVNVIFNLNDTRVTKALRKFRLKKLSLDGLPILEHVWDKDPEGNFGLHLLQEMRVDRCYTLKYLFPASVAKDLTRLEVLIVNYCKELVKIFWKDEIPAEGATMEFPRLTTLHLTDLPGLKDFYPGLHKLELPVLKDLSIYHCKLPVLKCQEDHPEEQPLVPIEKIPNMEMLSFGIGGTIVMWDRGSWKLQLHCLQRFQEESDSVLYGFLGMLPAIGKLELYQGSLKEMFCAERPNADYTRILLNLKEIMLFNMCNLNSIGLEHSWLHPIPENLQTLKVTSCDRLVNLVPHMVSLSNLTYLDVYMCKGMLYLFTSSTAKSLCQLKEMKIALCESMQEIVSTEGVESHADGKIIFEHLHTLLLKDLDKLRCFYSGKFALCFPSLEKVSLIRCSLMKTFSPINKVDTAILSSGVTFRREETQQWEGDLNSTILKRFEEKISDYAPKGTVVNLYDQPILQDIWHGSLPVPHTCFNNLEELIVAGCQFLSEVLPFNLLPFLTKMEKLAVRNCSFVKTIFDVKCTTEDRKMTMNGPALVPLPFSLKILTLEQLPNLESVWNEDPCGILTIELLKIVYVDECKSLASLFPASVAKDLVKLEELHVKHCEELIIIVAENNADPKGTNLELSFPCMISLTLLELPRIKCFYCSLHFDMLKIPTYQESRSEDEVISIEKLTPNLQCLSLGEKELKTISRRNRLHKLKVLQLACFNVESGVFPYTFLQQVPNIEKLAVSLSSLKEIFCFQGPDVVYTEFLSHLKVLTLELLTELVSIGLEHSWVEPLIKNLETLEIARCFRLRNIAASTICFSNLMRLYVSDCRGLVNLFTPSTAKSLVRLKTMEIICCESIQEIVSHEGDASDKDEKIVFKELQALYLKDLQELKCFYSGNFTVCFPSLEQVFVINCHKMETFCPGTVNADKLSGVKFQDMSDAVLLDIDLNSTIQKEFLTQVKPSSDVVVKEQENEVDGKDSL